MQIHSCGIRNGIEKFFYHLRIHISHAVGRKFSIEHKIRSSGKIHCAQDKCFIHRQNTASVTLDALFVPDRLFDRIAEHNSGIFDRVMTIHDQIALRLDRQIEKTVSATTRSPRPGEQEGVDYYYRTQEQFRQLIDTDQVVEYNFYNGNYYGTLREEVDKRLEAGKLVVLVIDVHGAANIRRMFPGATTVFLLPPSVEELEHRLRGRGTETEESIRERLATAQSELAEQDKFTLKLVNNEVASCAEELYQVICRRAGIAQ